MHHSLWLDIIHTNNERATNMSECCKHSIECSTGERERARLAHARAPLPSARHVHPGQADWSHRLPPATDTLGPHRDQKQCQTLVSECSATLNFGLLSRACNCRRERSSCARAAGSIGLSWDRQCGVRSMRA